MLISSKENNVLTLPLNNKALYERVFKLTINPVSSHLCKAIVSINPQIAHLVYEQTIKLFDTKNLYGFTEETTTVDYIEEHFKDEISKKVRNYLFKHFVIDFLIGEIIEQKIHISNSPRLYKIEDSHDKISFIFDLALSDPLDIKEWRNFSFTAPKRKRYKDLDKQVENFIEEESTYAKTTNKEHIEKNDWVYFEATLLDSELQPVHQHLKNSMWINITNEDVVDSYKNIFLTKKLNDIFVTNELEIDDSINDYDDHRYNFLIKINAIYKGKRLSIENLKNTFKLKNKVDIHNKLMEIFSYRDDQSQRKAIIEELFHLLLSKHRFEVPKHVILRRQEDIVLTLMKQPDFQVYKSQKDFHEQLEQLAEKQLKEETLIDQIAYKENIRVDMIDMQNYIHLFNNKRLHEFIYFKPYMHKIEYTGIPINAGIFSQTVMREKTLNQIIYEITR